MNQLFRLDHQPYMLWRTAFYDPDRHANLTFTRRHLAALAQRTFGARQAGEEINRLVACGLLAELHPNQPWPFLTNCRMLPSAEGLGNSPDDVTRFMVSRAAQPDLILDWDLYMIWSTAGTHRNLADTVRQHARQQRATRKQLDHLVLATAAAIPVLVSTHCAYLFHSTDRLFKSAN
ncbi:hypothetical protein [Fodinicola acaciae]|uniref:hypothetical protein n=1 Tax=Fodinicola acaciae TaxID=2681555 RepID=UPI0013D0B062|nr:hypothetical protein [Fodinicola acaciae]